MITTENYNLLQYEGADKFNPLTVEAQNVSKIDNTMFDIQNTAIPTATELKTGTIHTLTRSTPDAAMFRFVATATWAAGDTCTVDGQQVSTLLPTGETLPAGAWVINANVLCCLVGTVLTVFTTTPTQGGTTEIDATTLDGHTADYFAVAADTPAKSKDVTVQLGVGLWTASGDKYTQSVAVAGVTASAPNIVCAPAAASWDAAIAANVRMTAQGSGIVTFTADAVPDSVLYFNLIKVF
nr:MAG TPA: hypothetical protein [Bacteriophage sp.]